MCEYDTRLLTNSFNLACRLKKLFKTSFSSEMTHLQSLYQVFLENEGDIGNDIPSKSDNKLVPISNQKQNVLGVSIIWDN